MDDLWYAGKPGYEDAINEVLKTLCAREANDTPFSFCGKEIKQFGDFSVKVPAKGNTDKIKPTPTKKSNRLVLPGLEMAEIVQQ